MRPTKPALALLALLTTISTTSCAPPAPAPVADTACSAFGPIYLSEGAITALRPYRADRERIAGHNDAWRTICPAAGR